MRLCLLSLCAVVFFCKAIAAQQTARTTGQKKSLPLKNIYRFPAFVDGTLVMRNGIIFSQRLNYNISRDEMDMINQQGDTLALPQPAAISFINLNRNRFYYDAGYLQTIDSCGEIILAFRQVLIEQPPSQKVKGTQTARNAMKPAGLFCGNGKNYQVEKNKTTRITTREFYFFGDAAGHFINAGEAWLLQHFPEHVTAIKTFIKTSHTRFDKPGDLHRLLACCRKFS